MAVNRVVEYNITPVTGNRMFLLWLFLLFADVSWFYVVLLRWLLVISVVLGVTTVTSAKVTSVTGHVGAS